MIEVLLVAKPGLFVYFFWMAFMALFHLFLFLQNTITIQLTNQIAFTWHLYMTISYMAIYTWQFQITWQLYLQGIYNFIYM